MKRETCARKKKYQPKTEIAASKQLNRRERRKYGKGRRKLITHHGSNILSSSAQKRKDVELKIEKMELETIEDSQTYDPKN